MNKIKLTTIVQLIESLCSELIAVFVFSRDVLRGISIVPFPAVLSFSISCRLQWGSYLASLEENHGTFPVCTCFLPIRHRNFTWRRSRSSTSYSNLTPLTSSCWILRVVSGTLSLSSLRTGNDPLAK